MTRFVVRLAVAVLVAAAVGLGTPGPAQAATCGSANGVSVVVEFHQLGGGVQTFCDAGGAGKTADAQLRDAGHELTPVQSQPGFICRIDDEPADDPCVNTPPADAYWALWWSDGKSGTWTFSSSGASSLKVPAGGYVAMSWQGGSSKVPPVTSPTPHATQPTASPTTRPTSSPHPTTGPVQAPSSSDAPVAPATSRVTRSPSTRPSDGATSKGGHDGAKPPKKSKARDEASDGSDDTRAVGSAGDVTAGDPEESGGSGSGGLPGWVAPVAIAVLFGGVGTIALVRRKSSGGA